MGKFKKNGPRQFFVQKKKTQKEKAVIGVDVLKVCGERFYNYTQNINAIYLINLFING